MNGPDKSKELASQIRKLLAGNSMPVVATAMVEVLGVLIVFMAKDDTPEAKQEVADLLADSAVDMAGAISRDLLEAVEVEFKAQEEKRRAALAASTGPKRKSPWGEPR